jgi:hypothetical protein
VTTRRTFRFRDALAAAAILHVAIGLVVQRARPTTPGLPPRETLHFFDLSLVAPEPDSIPDLAAREALAVSPESVGAVEKPAPAHRTTSETAPLFAPSPSEMPPEDVPVAKGAASAEAPKQSLGLEALGLGGTNPFLGRGMAEIDGAPSTAPPSAELVDPNAAQRRTELAERRLERSLVTGMLDHDRAAGASRAGPVALALEESARAVSSPVNGSAEFLATIDATGVVVGLRPMRASPLVSEWARVAADALGRLAKKRLAVPSGSRGLEVRLALSSKSAHPSGASSATLHREKIFSDDGTKLSRLDLPPESRHLPDGNGPDAVNAPLLRQPVPASGVDGDLADIGSSTRRVVHVSIVSERPL